MPKASPILTSFNAGELSDKLEGRVDLAKYASGVRTLENFLPEVQGPVTKRPGFRFVKETADSAKQTRLIPFEFNTEQAYVIAFGDNKLQFYRNEGVVTETAKSLSGAGINDANPVAVEVATHGYATGDEVFLTGTPQGEVNDRFFTITVTGASTFTLDGEDGTGRSTGVSGTAARVYEVNDTGSGTTSVPWTEADVDQIQVAQSADVLYVAHPSYPPHKITRTGDAAWTSEEIDFAYPPFLPLGAKTVAQTETCYFTGSPLVAASVTVITSASVFTDPDDVGRKFKIAVPPLARYTKWAAGAGNAAGNYFVNSVGRVYKVISGTGNAGVNEPVHSIPGQREPDATLTASPITVWEFMHNGAGYGTITSITNGTTAVMTVDSELPSNGTGGTFINIAYPSLDWQFGAWDDVSGYPRTVAFFEDRLWWAGTDAQPQTLWASRTGDYENHEVSDSDESALIYTLNTNQVNQIEWLSPGKVLSVGTAGGEFIVSASNLEEALTPGNVRVVRHSTYGSRNVAPVGVESVVLFVQRSGKRVREFVFKFEEDTYLAPDLTLLSEDVADGIIEHMAYQQEPSRILWCSLADGSLIAFTYERDQDVVGWHRHPVGGTASAVESIASIPKSDGSGDQLWAVVKRTINGGTKRYVEFLEDRWDTSMAIADAFFVDSGLTYSGGATSTLTGLDHLEGETVAVLEDGVVAASKTVSGGSITLDSSSTKVQVGLSYNSDLETMRVDAGAADGTAQGRIKRIHYLVARLFQSGEKISYGPTLTNLDQYDLGSSLFDGDTIPLLFPGGWEQEGRIALRHSDPVPCTVVALMPQLNTGER